MMPLKAYFMAHTGVQIPTLHEMLEKLYILILVLLHWQIVFVLSLFHDVYFTSWLFWRTIRCNECECVLITGT